MNSITDLIGEILASLLQKLDIPCQGPVEVEIPGRREFGDYSSSLPLKLSRELKTNPLSLGEKMVQALSAARHEAFEKVELAKPGFINFFISPSCLLRNLKDIFEKKEGYGGRPPGPDSRKIIMEFVSANPTGPLNVVNARSACVGDVLTKLLRHIGHTVTREYYINDAGRQVELLAQSVLIRIRQALGENISLGEEHYQGEYVKDLAKEIIDSGFYEKIKGENDPAARIRERALSRIVASQKETLKNYNVEFENWFSEKGLRESTALDACLGLLKKKDLVLEEDGKILFRSTAFGDEKDRVIVRENGEPTYFFVDMAYHLDKIGRGFDRIVDLWGPDHDGYMPRMRGAMKAFGFGAFEILIIQQVNLIEKSQKVKMSKRLGTFVLMQDLIRDIGVDAARFFFLHRSVSSHLDFDLDLARKQTDDNPVYYVQYAHARICNIFVQAKARGVAFEGRAAFDQGNLTREEILLMKKLLQFPVMVQSAAEKYQPNMLPAYLLELSAVFHQFYTENRVLSDDAVSTRNRLFLAETARIVLKNGLTLMGVSAPERM